jgi:hypothetical protein
MRACALLAYALLALQAASCADNVTLSDDIVVINKVGMTAIYVVAGIASTIVLSLVVRCLVRLKNTARDVEMGWARHLVFLS